MKVSYSAITFAITIFTGLVAYASESMRIFRGVTEGYDFAILNAVVCIGFAVLTLGLEFVKEIGKTEPIT